MLDMRRMMSVGGRQEAHDERAGEGGKRCDVAD